MSIAEIIDLPLTRKPLVPPTPPRDWSRCAIASGTSRMRWSRSWPASYRSWAWWNLDGGRFAARNATAGHPYWRRLAPDRRWRLAKPM